MVKSCTKTIINSGFSCSYLTRFETEAEEEFVTREPAREGVWPSISRYETSTTDGFTIGGSVDALNQAFLFFFCFRSRYFNCFFCCTWFLQVKVLALYFSTLPATISCAIAPGPGLVADPADAPSRFAQLGEPQRGPAAHALLGGVT